MKPKVLVYVPCHNNKEFIRECLDSALSQTYSKQEIVVSFNGCDDGVDLLVAKEYPMVRTLHYKPFNKIMNPGINEALKTTDCEVYMQLPSDDKMVKGYWEEVLPLFEEDIGFIRIGLYQFSEKLPEGSHWKPFPLIIPEEILEYNKIFHSSPIRKVVWESVGGYDPKQPIFGDWDFWIKAILIHKWKWKDLDKPLVWYRRHEKAESYNYDQSTNGTPYLMMKKKYKYLTEHYGGPSSLR